MDHTPVDLIIVDSELREPIGRPYLTVAIDVFSRCITGFYLSLEPPSAVSVGLCLVHAICDKTQWLADRSIDTSWEIWGKPDCLYVDNAAEFHSEALQRGCEVHGIQLKFRPPGQPHYGGIIERVIGTLMQLVHEIPGITFSNINERGHYPSERMACLTLSELEYWLTIAITQYYHLKIHSSLQLPPIEKYKLGIMGNAQQIGRGLPPRLINKKSFLIDFLPVERRSLQRYGFVLDHITYWNTALSPLIAERKKLNPFMIRRNPTDLSRIYVFDPQTKSYLEVPYRSISRPSITLWEQQQAIKLLKKKGLEHYNENAIFSAIETLRHITHEAKSKTKSARRRHERRQQIQPLPTPQKNIEASNDNSEQKNTIAVKPFEDIELW